MNTVRPNEEPYLTDVVEGSEGTTVYEGFADYQNPQTSEAKFAIKRTIIPTTGAITETWADGNTNKDNVWNDRLTITTYKPLI